MDFEGVKKYVIGRLQKELNPDLCYHSLDHTLDVLEAAERLAALEHVNGNDLILLKTGALFHDLGFVEVYDGHETVSIRLAHEVLPGFGYSASQIRKVEGLIRCTEVPQHPTTHLQEIMADADLDYLGREDAFLTSQKLQYEWKKFGMISSLREWHEKQLAFLKSHKYFTKAAVELREKGKRDNIIQLETLMCSKK